MLKRFCLHKGTGGKGRFDGGDGVTRELLFRKQLTLSILSERRAFRPYGMKGIFSVIFNFSFLAMLMLEILEGRWYVVSDL